MSLIYGILLILSGFAIMGFGLLLFYAWLPLLYALLGLDLGLLLGSWLTGGIGVVTIALGGICAVIFACAAYYLEPLRRILLGVSAGALLGLALADLLGVNRLIGGAQSHLFALVGALIGGVIVPLLFRPFIVVSSAFSGASMVIAGAGLLLPDLRVFDHGSGSFLPTLLIFLLGLFGMAWQMKNIERWARITPGLSASAERGDAVDTKEQTRGDEIW